jgi:hypothetical protein
VDRPRLPVPRKKLECQFCHRFFISRARHERYCYLNLNRKKGLKCRNCSYHASRKDVLIRHEKSCCKEARPVDFIPTGTNVTLVWVRSGRGGIGTRSHVAVYLPREVRLSVDAVCSAL